MVYFHRRRVSYREDETTQEPSQSTMLLHQWESEMLEWRGKLARMQELELLRDQFQNEMKSWKMIVKAQDGSLIQTLGELDSLKKTVKTQDESLIQLLSKIDSVRKMEEEDEHNAHSQIDRNLVRKIQEEDDRPAHCQNEGDLVRNIEEQDECNVHFHNEWDQVRNLAMRVEERHVRFQEFVDIIPVITDEEEDEDEFEDEDGACSQDELNSVRTMEMEDERPRHFQNESYSVRTMEDEGERPGDFHNKGDPVRNSATVEEERRLNLQQVVDILPTIMEENAEDDEDKDFAHFLDKLNSLRTMVMEDEHPAHFQNDRDSVRNLAMRAEERRLRFQQCVDIIPVIIEEDEDEDEDGACSQDELNSVMTMEMDYERPRHFQNESYSVRTMEERERPTHFQNERDSVSNLKIRAVERRLRFQLIEDTIPVVMEEDQHDAHYPDAVDSLKIKTERLPLMLAEETIAHQASMETHVKTQSQRKNCIVASKAMGDKEKKVQMNKMGVGLTPPSNFKASRAKIVSHTSPCHTPGGRNIKIYNKKVDYSKVKAKVDTWRKT
jgi:hypothetical protein